MIFSEDLFKTLKKNKIDFFSGVPDSILKNFLNTIENLPKNKNLITVNEGSAISFGIGYYLSKSKIPCVYFQNSGLSNAMNPLISIANKKVYSIPMILLIGWRGSPNKQDEPQHIAKGRITTDLLKLLKIDYKVLRKKSDLKFIKKLINKSKKENKITAFLIEKGTLKNKKKFTRKIDKSLIKRYNFISKFLKLLPKKSKIVSTTGYTSRELMKLSNLETIKKVQSFYMVGGMGHSASVAAGFAMHSSKKIFCLDGDGSILMHLGSLRTIGFLNNKNFKHIVLNNNSHESVGGQPTNADKIDFKNLSKSLGYKNYFFIKNKKNIIKTLKQFNKSKGPGLLEVKIRSETIENLPRPTNLDKIKKNFLI